MSIDSQNVRVNLELFEGPLDLLLHLIRKNDLNIYNIPVALVLEQYLEHLELMKELNIDIAGDFLLLASELTHIKSRLLVARPEEEEEEEDPRADLVARLLEYQRYKRGAQWLISRPMLNRDVFKRVVPLEVEEEAATLSIDPFTLIRVFQDILKKIPKEARHEIETERVSVTDRIYEVLDLLKRESQTRFEDLFLGSVSRSDLVITFLALLEMARLKMISITQSENWGTIWVKRKIEIVEETQQLRSPADSERV